VDIPQELIDSFLGGNGVVFVGAGLSMGAGLPSWATLIEPLRAEIPDCPADCALTDVAQYYEDLHDRRRLIEKVQTGILGTAAKPTPAHHALLALSSRPIFTTNFDTLLEDAARAGGADFGVIVEGPDWTLHGDRPVQIIKTHGDIRNAKSITITTADYDHFGQVKRVMAKRLESELQVRPALFIGYSFSDSDLRLILSQNARELQEFRRNIFALQFSPSDLAIKSMTRLGVRIIALELQPGQTRNEALVDWLQSFHSAVELKRRQAGQREQTRCSNLPPAPHLLVGRTDESNRIYDSLSSDFSLILIEGPAGVGKTSLMLRVAHECCTSIDKPGFYDGPFSYVIWISADEYPSRTVYRKNVVEAVVRATGWEITDIDDADNRLGLRVALRVTRILMVIDGVDGRTATSLMDWFGPIHGPSKIVILATTDTPTGGEAIVLGNLKADEAAWMIRSHAKERGLSQFIRLDKVVLSKLVSLTNGNPLLIRLAVALTEKLGDVGRLLEQVEELRERGAFNPLQEICWEALSDHGRDVLSAAVLFAGGPIPEGALRSASACVDHKAFRLGADDCERMGLIERVPERAVRAVLYTVGRSARDLAQNHLSAEREVGIMRRMARHYLNIVHTNVARAVPAPRYWNTLVSPKMSEIDEHWPNIRAVIEWTAAAGYSSEFVQFVMLLVHYMDSRMYNADRLLYVKFAIVILHSQNAWGDEALLRIDAAGWTYIEEGNLEEAEREIRAGIGLADLHGGAERQDLLALGHAWLARVHLERGALVLAKAEINLSRGFECSPWIKLRVLMAAGDIHLRDDEPEAALASYLDAARQPDEHYGTEGNGYQTLPRIGLAQLALGQLDQADLTFRQLKQTDEIPLAGLYADYGLALVTFQRGKISHARAMIADIRKTLKHRTAPNLLLKLVDQFYDELERARTVGGSTTAAL
jgi:tetratricopeptide (TPR) repeat protein